MVAYRDPRIDSLEQDIINHFEKRKLPNLPRHIFEQIIADNDLKPEDRNHLVVVLNGPGRLAKRQRLLKHNGMRRYGYSAWHYLDLDHCRTIREENYRERYANPAKRNLNEWQTDVKVGNSDEPEIILQLRLRKKEGWASEFKFKEKELDEIINIVKSAYESKNPVDKEFGFSKAETPSLLIPKRKMN